MTVEARSPGVGLDEVLLPTTVIGSYPQPAWLVGRRSPGAGSGDLADCPRSAR